MNRKQILNELIEVGVVAVIRLSDPTKLLKVVDAIRLGGVKNIEITMTVPNAIKMIEKVAKEFADRILLGVGSVLDAHTAEAAINAGAKFVVSPIFKKEMLKKAHTLNVPVMPGCFTPTEIQAAWEAGADLVKVFPADVLGMPFFKSVLAPMPHLKLMPTGGVSLTNAGEWIHAGACAVGIGSALLDKKAIIEENYQQLTDNAKTIMKSIAGARK